MEVPLLSPCAEECLAKASDIPWFEHVGQSLDQFGMGSVVGVYSWQEALDRAVSDEWYQVRERSARYIINELSLVSRALFASWQKEYESIELRIRDIVLQQIGASRIDSIVTDEHVESICFDWVHIILEIEFYLVKPEMGLFGYIAGIYCRGHYPCGWVTDSNEMGGRIYVY